MFDVKKCHLGFSNMAAIDKFSLRKADEGTEVSSVKGKHRQDSLDLSRVMPIGTLAVYDTLISNLPGAKANSQKHRHIERFKMAAIQKLIFKFPFLSVSHRSHTFTNSRQIT